VVIVEAGKLKHRITILKPSDGTTTDGYGQPLDDPVEVARPWAAIEPITGRDYLAAMQENAEVTTRIRIRYRAGIERSMIVRYGQSEFEILYIAHPEYAKKELHLMCKERQ